jgi:cytochrome o ubiquinol oxidase subunit 2
MLFKAISLSLRMSSPPRCRSLVLLLLAPELTGCHPADRGFFAPHGPVAGADAHLFVIVVMVMAIVVVPVFILTPWFAWRYRLSNKASPYRPKWDFSWPLEVLIWGVPAAIVTSLGIILWQDTHRLDPFRPIASSVAPLEVQAVGLDWKWLFIYPDQHIAALNELAFPADRPVHISITSDTVMQSLLIPQLAGQIYAMAGMTTQLNLMADSPGQFIGENTQFNGMGFQNEKFVARALAPDDFTQWVARARASNTPLDADEYARIAEKSSVKHPVYFSAVQDGLFTQIIHHYRPGTPLAARTP